MNCHYSLLVEECKDTNFPRIAPSSSNSGVFKDDKPVRASSSSNWGENKDEGPKIITTFEEKDALYQLIVIAAGAQSPYLCNRKLNKPYS